MSVTSMVSRSCDLFRTRRALSFAASLSLNGTAARDIHYFALADEKLGRRTKSSAVALARHARFKRPRNAEHPNKKHIPEKFLVGKEFHDNRGSQGAGYARGEPREMSGTGSRLSRASELRGGKECGQNEMESP